VQTYEVFLAKPNYLNFILGNVKPKGWIGQFFCLKSYSMFKTNKKRVFSFISTRSAHRSAALLACRDCPTGMTELN
jgi:hypothetical protein